MMIAIRYILATIVAAATPSQGATAAQPQHVITMQTPTEQIEESGQEIKPSRNFKDIQGERFGRLTVLRRVENDKASRAQWRCLCDCKTECVVRGKHLRQGVIRSCGCLQREAASNSNTTHGGTSGGKLHPLFQTWAAIKQRCENPKCRAFPHYGGRGITMCERWKGKDGFTNFLADMGDKPFPELSIERENNDLGYCKENCSWQTRAVQHNNMRSNVRIEYNGQTQTLTQWSRICGISKSLLSWRIFKAKWPLERAFGINPQAT